MGRIRALRLLLDTHIWLWALAERSRLPLEIRETLEDSERAILVSVASIWEATIKWSLKKLELRAHPGEVVDATVRQSRFSLLDVQVQHALAVADLPHLHRDPFDRLIVAQARVEDLTLVTVDPRVRDYDVAVFPPRK